jgi:hypothetical protein
MTGAHEKLDGRGNFGARRVGGASGIQDVGFGWAWEFDVRLYLQGAKAVWQPCSLSVLYDPR